MKAAEKTLDPYTERNIDDCEVKIKSLQARIKKADASSEEDYDLQEALDGYTDKLAELKA